MTYGGRAYYGVGGYGYYMGYHPYPFFYGAMAYAYLTPIYMVGPMYYGCYSCGSRTCQSCSGCYSRETCGHEATHRVQAPQDRFEMDAPFATPELGSAAWPLTLTVHNFTVFTPQSAVATGQAYMSFTTESGDTYEDIHTWLLGLGGILFLITLLCGCANYDRICGGYDDDVLIHREVTEVHHVNEVQLGGMHGYPPSGFGQPAYGQPAYGQQVQYLDDGTTVICSGAGGPPLYAGGAYPSAGAAYPQAQGMYPSAMPTAMPTATPVMGGGLPVAQPVVGGGIPVATPVAGTSSMPIAQGHHVKSM